jgi:hypothetical protein
MEDIYKLLIGIIIVIIIVAAGIGLSNGDGDENNKPDPVEEGKRWEELDNFRGLLYKNYTVEEKSTSSTAVLSKVDDPTDAVWIIIGVERAFTSEEASAVRNFVKNGGDLILASDSTYANKISRQFAVEYSTHRIIETSYYDENELFIPTVATLEGTSYLLLTNSPLGMLYNSSVTTIDIDEIASSSEYEGYGLFSFIDENDDGVADADDTLGPIPIIVEIQLNNVDGAGKMIFIGDSALFSNDLWDRETNKGSYQNKDFCDALLKYTISPQGTVIYDYSKHENIQSGQLVFPL